MRRIKRRVVTGGVGSNGSHLAEEWARRDYQLIILDGLSTGKMGKIELFLRKEELELLERSITDLPLVEKPDSQSPYAVTKLASEYLCRVFQEVCGLVISCLKYFNAYGPRQAPNSQYAMIIPRFISRVFMGTFLEKGLREV